MASSDKTQWIKAMRDERHPPFFAAALQLMSGQKVTVCTPVVLLCLKESSQPQLSARFYSAFILCCNYSRGLSALWALSGGATPSTASESVLRTISPRCEHYTFKRKRWWWKYSLTVKLLYSKAVLVLFLVLKTTSCSCQKVSSSSVKTHPTLLCKRTIFIWSDKSTFILHNSLKIRSF